MLGGGVSHPLQLTTGLVVNILVITSPTLAGEHMLLIPEGKYSVGTNSVFRKFYCQKQRK